MNKLRVIIQEVQHIASLTLELNLEDPGLHCLVGRNGVGKTTLVRALRNLSTADTFIKTAPPRIFRQGSSISYDLDGTEFLFTYDAALRTLNCRTTIPEEVRDMISAELPIPHGARFNYARSASSADDEIRKSIALESYVRPDELIAFLAAVYETDRYSGLIEVRAKAQSFYAIANSDGTYIREDYLSSGEHFLINLYRTIKSNARLIVIDEIDLSLDAAAQVKISAWLRTFCATYTCKILFTTHSLAVMKTLYPTELFYLEASDVATTIAPVSYSYIKARLFGFQGWDRYILTEDRVLQGLIVHLLAHHCPPSFYSCKIIYIGGATQVVDLLRRNLDEQFLAAGHNAIAILDGDQKHTPQAAYPSVHLLPIESVEKDLYSRRHSDAAFPFHYARQTFSGDKDFFNYLQQTNVATLTEIYEYLVYSHKVEFEDLVGSLTSFLSLQHSVEATPVAA